ncbi:MAG: diguanylate cyclase [Rhodospirillaceae bacterium]|jgi:diguanylate cyclase (GGDEF)-like protein/PAS domain S-box-containing protein|nr:diguanylate cyclase [Rhodospirillaceae bacterium]MBT5373811.1 diguanylate cyclase [Rhodospirillaceae bacterium]
MGSFFSRFFKNFKVNSNAGDIAGIFSRENFFTRLPLALIAVDEEGGVIAGNLSARELIGGIAASGGEEFFTVVDKSSLTGEIQTSTISVSYPGARKISFWEVTALPKVTTGFDKDSSLEIPVLVMCRDVTLNRNMRAALADSRQRYKQLVEASNDFAWETGEDGGFVFVSPRGGLGYSAEDLIGTQPREKIIVDGRGDLVTPFSTRHHLENARIWFRHKDGGAACLDVTCEPLNKSGKWIGARGVCRDVTDDSKKDDDLRRMKEQAEAITHIVRTIRDVIEPQEMLAAAAKQTVGGVGGIACRIYRLSNEGGFYDAASIGPLPDGAEDLIGGLAGEKKCVKAEVSDKRGIAMPTFYQNHINGAITLWRDIDAPDWSEDECRLLSIIADQIGIALEQIENGEELERISSTDALTGLLNRRVFFEIIRDRMKHAQRTGNRNALCYVDFDNFKLVNDVHGHKKGDEALKYLTVLLKENTRANDVVGRLGGDEFAIWLEENDEEGAAASADKLLESTASLHQFSGSPEKPLGLSIGIAVYDPSSLESVEDLVSRADEAMYVIKKGSKGGYVISDPAPKSDESTSGVMEASS